MAKYLEVINDDSRIVLDDSSKCPELLTVAAMSNAKKTIVSDSYVYYTLDHPAVTADHIFVGIGLNELKGKSFCITLTPYHNGVRIEFFDPATGKPNTVPRDDVIAAGKIYVFGVGGRTPSEHLTGFEVYGADGKVVYTSASKHFNVLYCGGDESATVNFTGTTVALQLGSDDYVRIAIKSHHVAPEGIESHLAPFFDISENSVTIKKRMFNTIYVGDSDGDDHDYPETHVTFYAWYTYGYLVGEIV